MKKRMEFFNRILSDHVGAYPVKKPLARRDTFFSRLDNKLIVSA
jgi:hypothetical protein